VSEPDDGWSLLQLAELLRAGEQLLRAGVGALGEVTPDLPPGRTAVVSAAQTTELRELGEAVADLACRIQALTERLPQWDLELTIDGVSARAVEDLAGGIIDPARVLLAARVTPAGPGWRALARALRTGDAHGAWDGLAARDLLARFRGADEPLVQRVLAAAQLPPDEPLAAHDAQAVARLAAALEEHAPGEGNAPSADVRRG
jgi:hypothetical protein